MIRVGHKREILWAIVKAVAVYVVNLLRAQKPPAKLLLHDPSVLQLPSSLRRLDAPIAWSLAKRREHLRAGGPPVGFLLTFRSRSEALGAIVRVRPKLSHKPPQLPLSLGGSGPRECVPCCVGAVALKPSLVEIALCRLSASTLAQSLSCHAPLLITSLQAEVKGYA